MSLGDGPTPFGPGTRGAIERRKGSPCPCHSVGHASVAQPVELALVPVGEGVSQLDELLVHRPVAAAVLRCPPVVSHLEPSIQPGDPETPEVLLDASNVGVAPVDESALRRGRDEQRSELSLRLRQLDHPLSGEIVQVPDEGLELGDHAQDVRVSDRSTDLPWTTGTADFAHGTVRRGKRVDGLAARAEPRP